MNTPSLSPSANDFDFFVGSWQVQHARLRERLRACTDWEAFSGSCEVQKLLGGMGNIDDNLIELPEGPYRAVTLRSFDPAQGLWSIWWLDGRHPHRLDPPVVGSFEGDVGHFYADDELRGQPIRVRFTWTRAAELRWEQAFSADGGASWETNWRMSFRRRAAP